MQPSRLSLGAIVLAATAVAAVPLLGSPRPVSAATTTFTVTTAADPSSGTACPATASSPCSLREAVAAANTAGGDVVIDFAVPGPFILGNGELLVDGGETLVVQGASDGSTVIDGGGTDRIFDVSLALGLSRCASTVSSLTLSRVTLRNGLSSTTSSAPDDGWGGAVDVNCHNDLTVVDSVISGNTAPHGGGAIDSNTTASVTVLRSTISGNAAQGTTPADGGGAIALNTAATLVVIDSTLTGNQSAVDGGAVYAVAGSSLTLVNDTITGNTAPSTGAGGISAQVNATTGIANTIVSGNTPTDCAGTVTDNGHNLEKGTSCGFSSSAINADPKLGPLQANGGFAGTMALLPGSPAIDAGSDSVCAADPTAAAAGAGKLDERGAARPQGSHCDVGAFEVVATTTALSGPVSVTSGQAATFTATVSPAQPIPGQPAGTVTFLDGTTVLGTVQLSGSSPDTATFTFTPALGTHTLTARFEQTSLFLSSTSPGVSLATVITPPAAGGG